MSHRSRPVRVGSVRIGGGAPVAVQSMTKSRTDDVRATLRQIRALERAGCELVRIAVPDQAAAEALPEIRSRVTLPLIADIHFDHRLALAAIKAGFDKVRINPGNIGSAARVKEIVRAARDHHAAIRIGVNAGSVEKTVLRKHRHPTVAAMIESLERSLAPARQLGFEEIVLSAKTTSVPDTIAVYRQMAGRFPYPLHLGLTEAGLPFEGAIRSTAALAVLLAEGIGDTIRVSLTGNPVLEVRAAWELLAALGLRQRGPVVYACPTCGRTRARVFELTKKTRRALAGLDRPLKVAVMGCVVNGPGEAREADFGIACGAGRGLVFARGRVIRTCPEAGLVRALVAEVKRTET
ncbi:flavodoxin-dependent (E)-4-hydroxy-3-methylbut-2-enyl-diphosphate synthase [candidate division WOR-3 bacterium]|nr:flavodoxin-dependent (E)-4-hydroxy-3-methylbut-2-enyl-diphosphate synthase [candidate division WOR-3 bacterium]